MTHKFAYLAYIIVCHAQMSLPATNVKILISTMLLNNNALQYVNSISIIINNQAHVKLALIQIVTSALM